MAMISLARRRAHDRLAAQPGVRAVRRPLVAGAGDQFDLHYVRTGRKSAHPIVVIPGGPGAASVALYRAFRRKAAHAGLDVIMVEHRGVGLSRQDDDGRDLPPEAMTVDAAVDDIAAVLDDAGVEAAHIYGASYGTYLAAGFGVRHSGRVAGMVLDSPLLSAGDIAEVRAHVRAVLWDGEPGTEELAAMIRELVARGDFGPTAVLRATGLYELAGPDILRRQLELLVAGHDWLWAAVGLGTRLMVERETAFHHEPDLVERIAYRELNYGAEPDGGPLDPAVALREVALGDPEFVSEPYDLIAAMPGFGWPTAVLSGGRDLTTPPAVARRIAGLIPDATLVELPTAGHSMLDTRERAALQVCRAVSTGQTGKLAARAAELDALPANRSIRLLVRGVELAAKAEGIVPDGVPRLATS